MITAANREGYTGANVSAVIELAGVSRPTFYDYFADRDECFTATITDTHERLASQVDAALAAQRPELALQAAVGALVAFAAEEPARAHFVMSESMSGGPPALDARDRGVVELERAIERAQRQGSATKTMPDLPDRLVIGGIYRLLSSRLRRGETNLAPLADALSDWISRYGSPPASTAGTARSSPRPHPTPRSSSVSRRVHPSRSARVARGSPARRSPRTTASGSSTRPPRWRQRRDTGRRRSPTSHAAPASTAAPSTACSSTSRTRS
jgi:AcrR family transcriptional regulator